MSSQESTYLLRNAYQDFLGIILSLYDEQFISSMNGWSPRDVVAHLIGWNKLMIEASLSILAGKQPMYYQDAPNDYCNINSGFTAKYSSCEKQELLVYLNSSMEGFEAFIRDLTNKELTMDCGVRHYSGSPATVSKIIASLTGDYRHHTLQIREWLYIS